MSEGKKHLLLLGCLWFFLYVVGNHLLAVTDPVEGNYVETVREMLVSGDYISPQIYGKYWFDKPILFYWELAAAFKLGGVTDFVARMPAALMSLAGMCLLYWWGRRLYGTRVALTAALIMATSLEYWYVGHAVITDMTLLVTVSFTLLAFYHGYQSRKYYWYYGSYAAAALAVLDKGPLGLCLPGLIILIFLLWQRDLKALLVKEIFIGLGVFGVLVGIWYIPMYRLHGQVFLDVFLGVHNAMRATVSEHPEVDVWYYYTLIFLAGFFPWVWVAIPALIKKWRQGWRLKLSMETRFLLVWAGTVFFVFQCFATKYITYTLPYMFPVSLLLARYFSQWGRKFFVMVGAASVLYIGLLFGVAAPQTAANSARDVVAAAMPYLDNGADIYCYGKVRPVSWTYYTGCYLYQLVPEAQIKAQGKNDWSVTEVIPCKAIESVENSKPLIVLTREKYFQALQQDLPGNWRLLDSSGALRVYYRDPF
ncbi:Dolichyl-phosphate-mannose-protein mannosyltransferase [Selenomonas ruminantium]|uniref:Dolichyl-phosphate-mannose-protein mannosyltransferase n=1 Tax=Selenomonas ruminantium TaxID=971 RepID=A0A1M6VTL1_SELRU|nr:glycosyltransferase family 39 protein [Selenomonas ruminantium]SHK84751.1 Dolichyl-phosphate-mannose-protein mannosyltransferase [Selenomonas ruminantium]